MKLILALLSLFTLQLSLIGQNPGSQQKAIQIYPELGKAGSSFNTAFVREVAKRKTADPQFFDNPNWPTLLAKELSDARADAEALLTKELSGRIAAEAEAKVLAGKQRETERVNAMLKTIREVESDQRAFVGKQFLLTGNLDIGSYYNFGYGGAQDTHFAFELKQPGKTAYLYMARAVGDKVREKLVKHGGPLRATCVVTIPPARLEKTVQVYAELVEVLSPVEK